MSNRWRTILVIVAVLAIAVVAIYFFFLREDDRETATVQRGSLAVTIETVGQLEVENPLLLRSEISGVVLSYGVQPGDHVAAGDVVALLDPEPLRNAIATAEDQLERAEFELQITEAQTPPDAVGESIPLVNARAGVEAAQQALDDARAALQNAAIRSPIDGIVLETSVAEGQPVQASQIVAQLMRPGDLQLIAQLSEVDLPAVSKGTEVTFRLDAIPNIEINGVVERISPEATTQAGATTFPTTIRFDAPEDVDLRPGMNATVNFITDERQNVLLVPQSAVRAVGERTYVTVVRGGEEQEIEVVLGQQANGMAEVISGLNEGDVVVIN